jgi:riboflavin synthase
MFTGLIEAVGDVEAVGAAGQGFRIRIRTTLARELAPGDSLAVNGVCLTVVEPDDRGVHADVSPETVRVTTLGSLRAGARVNLERPLRADARVGGHFVQGHVDATGRITTLERQGDAYWFGVTYPPERSALLVPKGSIAVDGISLTIARLDAREVYVQIIPFTWDHTNLRAASVGDSVNLEFDVLGKYVQRSLEVQRHG